MMTTRIVVIGAGYAGLLAAIRLAGKSKRQDAQVTLINPVDTFVERVRLHEYVMNVPLKPRSIAALIRGTGVQFVRGWVTKVDPAAHEIVLDNQQHLGYDYLVYALGSMVNRDSTPGVREHAHVLNPHGSAEKLRDELVALGQTGGRVLVVGGGATGIEAAAEIKGAYPQLQLGLVTQGEIGTFKGAKVQTMIQASLQSQHISLHPHQQVEAVQKNALILRNSPPMPFDLCLWAGGFTAPPLAREAGLQVNGLGQILVDPLLRSVSHPEIYAVGDAGWPVHQPGAPIRMSALPALVMGAHTADNLHALLVGKPQTPFSFSWQGQAIGLGPQDALGFLTYPDDKPVGPIYRGGLAVKVRLFFISLLMGLLETERRFPGFFFWFGKGRYKMNTQPITVRPVTQSSK